ncbi:CRTAC1 family protein [Jannaschia sp. Os4]|uniref:CRTAC1 family protein n=1 Tax=Jannaschia sp. Os4 TaxID=2807617 RepID=UPI0031B6230E
MRAAVLLLLAAPASADIRFEPVEVPVHEYVGGWEHFVGGGAAVFDCDGDALPEIVAAGGEAPVALWRNRGGMDFEPGAFPETTGATGLYALDLDADGPLDLVVTRVGPNLAFRGDGACGFSPLPLPDGGDAWTTAFTAVWQGARPTLAFGNYVDRADPDGPFGTCDDNLLLEPEGAGWRETVLSPGHCALSLLASDEDRDGVPTLRLSNDRHYYLSGGREQMWSLAERRFLGPADGFDAPSLWGMGIASGDATGDGLPEIVLTSMADQVAYLSSPEGLTRAPYEAGLTAHRPHAGGDGRPSTGWHAEWADVENDGDLDLLIVKGNVDQMPGMAMKDPNNLLLNTGNGFVEASVEAGVASDHRGRGGAWADLDGDGRLDLVVVNRRAPLEVWRNVSDAGNAVAVELRQPGGNRHAVGAWVELRTEAGVQARELTVGGGHGGDAVAPLWFGIGAAEAAELRVIWPGGAAGPWRPVAPGRVEIVR